MISPTNGNPTCETCRWWRRWDVQRSAGVYGECRKLSPVVIVIPGHANGPDRSISKWPSTRNQDWCGRHRSTGASPIEHRGDLNHHEPSETLEPETHHEH